VALARERECALHLHGVDVSGAVDTVLGDHGQQVPEQGPLIGCQLLRGAADRCRRLAPAVLSADAGVTFEARRRLAAVGTPASRPRRGATSLLRRRAGCRGTLRAFRCA
jgi:hypothetical protein